MKIIRKCVLMISLMTVGAGISVFPTVDDAAVNSTTPVKNLTEKDIYFKIGKDEFVKATDVRLITNDDAASFEDYSQTGKQQFYLESLTNKSHVYDQSGAKLANKASKLIDLGGQRKMYDLTYYKVGSGQLVPIKK